MRTRIVLVVFVLALAAVPAAHAASATLTSPPSGATYYTGSQFTASVPWSATFDFSPCVGNNFHVGTVQRWDRTAPPAGDWPSNGGTGEGSLSGTNALFPGDYYFKAASNCAGNVVYSASVTIHVISGAAPTISDRDLDDVTDSTDQCPDVPGVKANDGCPVLDPPTPKPPKGDGDKVPDNKDKCDTKDGPAWHDGCPVNVPKALARKPQLRARSSSTCSLSKLRAEAKKRAPEFKGGRQVARLKRCYARGVPGVPNGWPLISFWSSAKFKPAFEVYPPELRPQNAPPITRVALKAKKGFNVYAVKKETSEHPVFLPVFSILTSESTPTNTGGRLQVGVIFPAKGSSGYKRIKV